MLCTRPYITQVVGLINKFINNIEKGHWEVVKWIIMYLRGNYHYFLYFIGLKIYLQGYVNSDTVIFMVGEVLQFMSLSLMV